MSTIDRKRSPMDALIGHCQQALWTALGPATTPQHRYPAASVPETEMSASEKHHAAGLMRVNHAGEVSAQALYLGQAAVSRRPHTRDHLLQSAQEEADHLAWCASRLEELGSQPSRLNLFWYLGSFAIGAAAGLAGDRISLGFVVETERQVEAHLAGHLTSLPPGDDRSRAIVRQMQLDEARHGQHAQQAGGAPLPAPIPRVMRWLADVMRWTAYRL